MDYTLKKSLGQHFLRDEGICLDIVDALKAKPFQRLLEVGPGGAALTKHLLKIPEIDFQAVELDDEKVVWLQKNYPELRGKIIHKSFLDMDAPFDLPFTLVGNFPYNISTQILFKVLEWEGKVEKVIGMFQKEVAQRVAAKEGSKTYGVISILIQAHFDVEYLFEVNENSFNPPPKVKSAVIRLTPRKEALVTNSPKKFSLLVKTAFNQRRKTLRNAVKALFEPVILEEALFDKRAEQLSIQDFAALSFRMR